MIMFSCKKRVRDLAILRSQSQVPSEESILPTTLSLKLTCLLHGVHLKLPLLVEVGSIRKSRYLRYPNRGP